MFIIILYLNYDFVSIIMILMNLYSQTLYIIFVLLNLLLLIHSILLNILLLLLFRFLLLALFLPSKIIRNFLPSNYLYLLQIEHPTDQINSTHELLLIIELLSQIEIFHILPYIYLRNFIIFDLKLSFYFFYFQNS